MTLLHLRFGDHFLAVFHYHNQLAQRMIALLNKISNVASIVVMLQRIGSAMLPMLRTKPCFLGWMKPIHRFDKISKIITIIICDTGYWKVEWWRELAAPLSARPSNGVSCITGTFENVLVAEDYLEYVPSHGHFVSERFSTESIGVITERFRGRGRLVLWATFAIMGNFCGEL
jgi:hypothetical protein